ncbi:MAG: VOC family protein [Chroococcidiopsidaceae cyanobacterium CP_BM_ER_R8_30]|nr:VOC family protein [Chroococcidiopsidaceae cyanobacterium CP_BM_ER_R8_30]
MVEVKTLSESVTVRLNTTENEVQQEMKLDQLQLTMKGCGIATKEIRQENNCQTKLRPFHLSICVNDLESTRNFYKTLLNIEERRASKSSVHFDFYGSQITFHEVPGYSAKNVQREVDAEDVPVPHFGAALSFEEFERVKERLISHGANFIKKPRLRFIGKGHEQHVMFIEDPSGHGIEIKSFTRAAVGDWA